MASIHTGIQLADSFTAPLMNIISSVNLAVANMEDMNNALNAGINTSTIEAARNELAQASAAAAELSESFQKIKSPAQMEKQMRHNIRAQDDMTQSVERCRSRVVQVGTGFKGWEKAIVVANSAAGLVKNTLGRIGVTDMSGAFGRMDTMNRFQKTMTTLTGDAGVADAALAELKENTLGTAYGLDVAGKTTQGFVTRGMGIGTAADQVRIWADAVSFYGKGTNEQLENVADAVGKIYTKGTVEQMQLDRIFEAGIPAAEIYANAVGRNIRDVKKDLTDGRIASAEFIETVSSALDKGVSAGAAKDAGGTWATTFSNAQAAVTRGWVSVIEKTDAALAAHGLPSTMEMVAIFGTKVESVLNAVGNGMELVIGMALGIGETLGTVGGFIADNWGTIAAVITGIAAAWGVYKAASIASSAAQWVMNAAMYACPVTWIAIAIGALVALVIALANKFSGAGHVARSTFGAICGGVNVVIQFFKNLGLSVVSTTLGIWEALKACAENLKTAFHNSICDVQGSFYFMLSTGLMVIEKLCEALNKLPFIEFDYSGISNAADKYVNKFAAAKNSKRDYTNVGDAFTKGITTYGYFQKGWAADAYKNGAKFGDKVTDKVKDFFKSKGNAGKDKEKFNKLPKTTLGNGGVANNTKKIADNTKKTADAVAITKEDLKYLRDMAERDYINKFTTAKITVNQTNHNKVNSSMDLDGMTEYLRATIEQQMLASAEGVH